MQNFLLKFNIFLNVLHQMKYFKYFIHSQQSQYNVISRSLVFRKYFATFCNSFLTSKPHSTLIIIFTIRHYAIIIKRRRYIRLFGSSAQ